MYVYFGMGLLLVQTFIWEWVGVWGFCRLGNGNQRLCETSHVHSLGGPVFKHPCNVPPSPGLATTCFNQP